MIQVDQGFCLCSSEHKSKPPEEAVKGLSMEGDVYGNIAGLHPQIVHVFRQASDHILYFQAVTIHFNNAYLRTVGQYNL